MKRKSKKRVLPLPTLLSRKILTFSAAVIIIIVFLLIYKNHNANNEIINSSQSPSPSAASSPPLYTTPINRPAEKCSVTNSSDTWDTYICTHFIFQLPKGWYGSYGIGQDKTLSYSEFYNYDYTKAPPHSTDPELQKIYLILYLSSKNVNEYITEDEIAIRKEYKQATFSISPITGNDYDGLKVHITGTRISPNISYVIQNPSKTVILTFGNIFGVNDTQLEEIFSTIKFTDSGN